MVSGLSCPILGKTLRNRAIKLGSPVTCGAFCHRLLPNTVLSAAPSAGRCNSAKVLRANSGAEVVLADSEFARLLRAGLAGPIGRSVPPLAVIETRHCQGSFIGGRGVLIGKSSDSPKIFKRTLSPLFSNVPWTIWPSLRPRSRATSALT